jgi:hypothetical protein
MAALTLENTFSFSGMRGKKSDHDAEAEYLYHQLLAKRGNSAFVGMRGKKNYEELEDDYGMMPMAAKRAGFVGMRGKKWQEKMSPNLSWSQTIMLNSRVRSGRGSRLAAGCCSGGLGSIPG